MNELLTKGFTSPATMLLDFRTEAEVTTRANAYAQNRRAYFAAEKWRLAGYALDLLLNRTAGKMRNDGTTPEWIHSARPTELLDSLTRAGFLDRRKVEKRYGSYQIAVCGQLLHDLGENEGVSPDFLQHYFEACIYHDKDPSYTGAQRIKDATAIPAIISDFVLLTNGKNGEKAFNEYLLDMIPSGYAFLIKLGDRNDNLATLIGLHQPDWQAVTDSPADTAAVNTYFNRIRRYYSHTAQTFSTQDLVGLATDHHPLLKDAFDALDATMDVLFRINRAYVGYHPHHPENAPTKSKRLDPSLLVIDISKSINRALNAHHFMHRGVDPLAIIMDRIAKEAETVPDLQLRFQDQPRDRGISLIGQFMSRFNRSPPSPLVF